MAVGTWIQRAGWAAVALCLLGMLTVRTVARWVSPSYAVATCQGSVDPWGEPWAWEGGKPIVGGAHLTTLPLQYSKGPNRLWEGGSGDDLFVLQAFVDTFGWLGVPWHYPLHSRPRRVFGALALFVTWLLRLVPALTAAGGGIRRELFRAALITIPPALLAYLGIELFRDVVSSSLAQKIESLESMLGKAFPSSIPPFAAASRSLAVLGYLLALAFRLRQRAIHSNAESTEGSAFT